MEGPRRKDSLGGDTGNIRGHVHVGMVSPGQAGRVGPAMGHVSIGPRGSVGVVGCSDRNIPLFFLVNTSQIMVVCCGKIFFSFLLRFFFFFLFF